MTAHWGSIFVNETTLVGINCYEKDRPPPPPPHTHLKTPKDSISSAGDIGSRHIYLQNFSCKRQVTVY